MCRDQLKLSMPGGPTVVLACELPRGHQGEHELVVRWRSGQDARTLLAHPNIRLSLSGR